MAQILLKVWVPLCYGYVVTVTIYHRRLHLSQLQQKTIWGNNRLVVLFPNNEVTLIMQHSKMVAEAESNTPLLVMSQVWSQTTSLRLKTSANVHPLHFMPVVDNAESNGPFDWIYKMVAHQRIKLCSYSPQTNCILSLPAHVKIGPRRGSRIRHVHIESVTS